MVRITWCAVALAVAVVPAYAQESETSKMREELRQLQQRMQSLEKNLQETDAKAGKAEESAAQAENTAAQAASQASNRPQPEIALNRPGSGIRKDVNSHLQRN